MLLEGGCHLDEEPINRDFSKQIGGHVGAYKILGGVTCCNTLLPTFICYIHSFHYIFLPNQTHLIPLKKASIIQFNINSNTHIYKKIMMYSHAFTNEM
jgi:hypothetical protein